MKKLKRVSALLLAALLIFTVIPFSVNAAENNTVVGYAETEEKAADIFVFKTDCKDVYYYNLDLKIPIDTSAQYVGGKTLVPLRAVSAAAGISDLKFSNSKITFTGFDGYSIEMAIDSTTCKISKGSQFVNITIPAPAIIGGVTMMPVRETANLIGGAVVYDNGYVVVSPKEIDSAKIADYIAAFEADASYTVTFKGYDGKVLKTQTVKSGAAATAPEAPARDGYKFIGWDKAFGNVTSDLVVTAQYEKIDTPSYEYTITYVPDLNDPYLQQQKIEIPADACGYNSKDGFYNLPILEVAGYNFMGWYDGTASNANRITQIPAGTKGDKKYYAKWEKVEYTITFDSPLAPVESISYTVDQGATLTNPDWFGYTFAGWTDEKGNIVKNISKGTIGNITLYANWTSKRNQTVPVSKLGAPIIEEDKENGVYLFAYEIGRIENVPLYTIKDFGNRTGITVTETVSTSGSITETSAQTIADMISNATTRSDSWTLSEEWNESTTISEEHSNEVSNEVIEESIKQHEINGKWNVSSGSGGTRSTTTENGTSAKVSSKVEAGVSAGPYEVKSEIGAEIGTTTSDSKTNSRSWNINEGYESGYSSSLNKAVSNSLSSKISSTSGYSQSKSHNTANSSTSALAVSQTESREYSSSLSYATAKTETSVKEYTNADAPEGWYRLVCAGTIHVFAVVGYDVETKSYFTYTYNIWDDEVKDFIDYSKGTSGFDDYENGVLPFEIPNEVNEYINNVANASDGLVVDTETGKIARYNGEATSVFVPEFMPVDNGDGTISVVKITGFEATAFKGKTNIKSIKFGKYVTEIPNSAFEGCTSLEKVTCPSVTKIGARAFAGCSAMEEFTVTNNITSLGTQAFVGVNKITVNAVNSNVVTAATNSGAKKIILNLAGLTDMLANKEFTISDTTDYFEFNGANKTYSGLKFVSDAAETVINGVAITNVKGTPLKLSSEKVTLNRVTVNATDLALTLSADTTTLALYGTVNINTAGSNAVLCKNVNLCWANPNAVGKLKVSGNMFVCGAIDGEENLTVTNGTITYIDIAAFEQMAQDSLDWVLASELPEGATVVDRKYSYTLRSYTTSGSSSLSDWTKYDTKRTSWGAWSGWSTTNPTNGVRNVESRSVFDHTEYHYYHWTNGTTGAYTFKKDDSYYLEERWFTYILPTSQHGTSLGYVGTDAGKNVWARADYSGNQSVSKTFTRSVNRTEWRYQDPVYTYYYYKDENKESSTNPTGENISNVQEWVKYVVK